MKKGLLFKTVLPNVTVMVIGGIIGFITLSFLISRITHLSIQNQETLVHQNLRVSASKEYETIKQLMLSSEQKALEEAALFSKSSSVIEAFKIAHTGNIDDPYSLEGVQARAMLKSGVQEYVDGYLNFSNRKEFKLHFHLPNGRSLARVWRTGWQTKVDGQKLDISDDISSFRKTVLDVNTTKVPITGIEVGRGGFVIRALVPISSETGEHLGSVEVLTSFSEALNALKESGVDFGVYMNQNLIDITTKLQDSSKYPILDNKFVRVSETNEDLFRRIISTDDISSSQTDEDMFKKIESYFVSGFPIHDYSGNSIGSIIISRDITEVLDQIEENATIAKKAATSLEWTILVGFIVVIALMVTITYRSIKFGLLKPLLRGIEITTKISDGNLSERLNLNRDDELGDFSHALDHMVQTLHGRAELAQSIAEGDLTHDVELASDQDVTGQAMQLMVERLNCILSDIQTAADHVKIHSNEIQSSSETLAESASKQAASLEEISSTVVEIGNQVKSNSEDADTVSTLASSMQERATDGEVKMGKLVRSMDEIKTSSQEIVKVIKVIDDIAFQTNLLALNAAVEAARAGQHGKGFAVVADEVRNLANRSAKAAKETSELIGKSGTMIHEGHSIAEETATSFKEIVENVVEINELTSNIATASIEQSSALSEVNIGFEQLNDATQSTAAVAEESSAASHVLNEQAEVLQKALKRFEVKETTNSNCKDIITSREYNLIEHQ